MSRAEITILNPGPNVHDVNRWRLHERRSVLLGGCPDCGGHWLPSAKGALVVRCELCGASFSTERIA